MKYLLLIIASLNFFSCKQSCEVSLEDKITTYSKQVDYDFHKQSEIFFDYLITVGLIQSYDKSSIVNFIEEEMYCLINYDHYIQEVDNTFSTSPFIGGAYAKCISKHDIPCEFELSINFDSLSILGKEYFKNMFNELDENDLNNEFVKLFLYYEINVLMGDCHRDTN